MKILCNNCKENNKCETFMRRLDCQYYCLTKVYSCNNCGNKILICSKCEIKTFLIGGLKIENYISYEDSLKKKSLEKIFDVSPSLGFKIKNNEFQIKPILLNYFYNDICQLILQYSAERYYSYCFPGVIWSNYCYFWQCPQCWTDFWI